SYTPLNAEGPSGHQVIGFARQQNGHRAIVLVPRLVASRLSDSDTPPTSPEIWEGTYVPLPPEWPRQWRCALSGEVVSGDARGGVHMVDVFRWLPVALLLG
ncbi:MAG TPA: hypothetical protein VHH32_01665, partial [Gemmatimonadales bacterium]|nr:hypothetical protein [Gemmatimonadales bacterium]